MFNVNTHSSIQIDDLYFDPYGITKNKNDAKYIFITHTHYDHLSIESLKRVANDDTIFIATKDANAQLEPHFNNKIIYVKPHEEISLGNVQVDVCRHITGIRSFTKRRTAGLDTKSQKTKPPTQYLATQTIFQNLLGYFAIICLFQLEELIPWTQQKLQP